GGSVFHRGSPPPPTHLAHPHPPPFPPGLRCPPPPPRDRFASRPPPGGRGFFPPLPWGEAADRRSAGEGAINAIRSPINNRRLLLRPFPVPRSGVARVFGQRSDPLHAQAEHRFDKSGFILGNLGVPNPEHLDPQTPKVVIPLLVAGLPPGVGVPVEFQHEQRGGTEEVRNVRADRVLAAELEPREPAFTQQPPDHLFGRNRI